MKTKPASRRQLIKRIKELGECLDIANRDISTMCRKIDFLEKKISDADSQETKLRNEISEHCQRIRLVCDILMGRASKTSKTEVLMDLLKIHEAIESEKNENIKGVRRVFYKN